MNGGASPPKGEENGEAENGQEESGPAED